MSKIKKSKLHLTALSMLVRGDQAHKNGMTDQQVIEVAEALAKSFALAKVLSNNKVSSSTVSSPLSVAFEAAPDVYLITFLLQDGTWESLLTMWPEQVSEPDEVVITYRSESLQQLKQQSMIVIGELYMGAPFSADFLDYHVLSDMEYLQEGYECLENLLMGDEIEIDGVPISLEYKVNVA